MSAQPIPYQELDRLAKAYGYHQLVLIARRVGDQGAECVITFGASDVHKTHVERWASLIKRRILNWPER